MPIALTVQVAEKFGYLPESDVTQSPDVFPKVTEKHHLGEVDRDSLFVS
ncbi:MAG: hypothetical protein KME16_15540 [Scytolyngbya sp. HA4215-MV1]|jgi:hypothetical protein|nr:hypothetical protein [Scytolyngbya sp. HA4215-MV1]